MHSLVFSLIRISFSKFDFPSHMGGSAPLDPPLQGGRMIVKQVCSLVRYTDIPLLQAVISSPRQRREKPGSQNPHGRKPVGEKPNFENGKPKTPIPNKTI